MQLKVPLPKRAKNMMKSVPEAMLPRYSANNDRYPVLDSLYKTIKSIL
jgi:hypothetical protein